MREPVGSSARRVPARLPLAVALGGARRAVHAGLDATGLRPLCTEVITGEDAPRGNRTRDDATSPVTSLTSKTTKVENPHIS